MKRKILSIILIILIVILSGNVSFASREGELQQGIEDKEEEIEQIKTEKNVALQEIQDLTSKINQYEEEINDLKYKINKLENSITEKQVQIEKLQKEYAEKEKLLRDRLVAIYMAGETTYLDVLLTSEDLTSLISNYYLVQQLAEADNELLTSIENQEKTIKDAKAQLETEKTEVNNAKAEIESKNNSLKANKQEKQLKVNKLNDEQKKIQNEIDTMEAELKKIYESASNTDGEIYSGELRWPVPSYGKDWITSPFGYRWHPIWGTYLGHKGVDIGGNYGTTIVAAEDGVVVDINTGCSHNYGKNYSCGCGGGYGNYVQVNHSNGLTTFYAHCQSVKVSVGQHVKRGQAIAEMGSTGSSTGAHLHFEVIINGVPKNPMNYV